MKMTVTPDLEAFPATLRSAWDIRRACAPMAGMPMSPSISLRGTRAETESTTTTSTAPERMRSSMMLKACSPWSGCETMSSSAFTPRRRA